MDEKNKIHGTRAFPPCDGSIDLPEKAWLGRTVYYVGDDDRKFCPTCVNRSKTGKACNIVAFGIAQTAGHIKCDNCHKEIKES